MNKEFSVHITKTCSDDDDDHYRIHLCIPKEEFDWCSESELEPTIKAACAQALLAELIKDMQQKGAEDFLASFMANTLQFSRSIVLPGEA